MINYVERIEHSFHRLSEIGLVGRGVAFLMAFVAPLYHFLTVLLLLMVTDMLTSIWMQYKEKKRRCKEIRRGEVKKEHYLLWCFRVLWSTIKPDKISQSVEKLVSYSVALIVCFVLDAYVLRQGLAPDGLLMTVSITNAVYVLILIAEGISIMRNLGRITNNSVFRQVEKILLKKTNIGEIHENATRQESDS